MNVRNSIFAPTELRKMWDANHIYIDKKTAAGVDGVTKPDFVGKLDFQLSKISHQVLESEFGYQPLRAIPIIKSSGKIRLINVPTIADRFVQRCVLQKLLSSYSDKWRTGISFGALREESTRAVLAQVKSNAERFRWALKSDISSYFDNIDRQLIKAEVRRRVRHKSLWPLIEGAIDCEPELNDPKDKANFRDAGLTLGKGVRQGMTLSPLLAYLFLLDEDRGTPPDRFFRYVDDIVFFGNSKAEVTDAFNRYAESLKVKGLQLAEHKTKLIEPKQRLEFLGIELDREGAEVRYLIPATARSRIRARITEAVTLKGLSTSKQRGWLIRAATYVRGVRHSYEYAYGFCDNWPGFRAELSDLQKHACRRIAEQLQEAAVASDRKMLGRLFGIHG